MNSIIQLVIQMAILMLAGVGYSCDNFVIRFVLFLLACIGMNVYHKFLKKIEKE